MDNQPVVRRNTHIELNHVASDGRRVAKCRKRILRPQQLSAPVSDHQRSAGLAESGGGEKDQYQESHALRQYDLGT